MGNLFGCFKGEPQPQPHQHNSKRANNEPEHFHDNDKLAAEANKVREEARRLRDEAHRPENKLQKGNLLDRANAEDARASQLVFDRLNAPGRHPEGTVDLHLQFVADAVRIAGQSAERARARGINKLVLIVGKGNHSEGGKAKIHPAIVDWAKQNNLKYSEEEGRIVVDL